MKTHVITGAASGIGLEVASRLNARGDRLILLARSAERATSLEATFPEAEVVVADLANPESLPALAIESLDSLLHIAGVVDLDTVADFDLAQWEAQLAVNLTAPAVLTQGLLPALRAGHGTVVFVNSGAGLVANPSWAGYAASKFGLRALAAALRAEEPSVRVTSVFPSRTATPMQAKVHEQEGKEYDASQWIRASTVADTILHVLDLPADASVPEISVRPTGRA